MGTHCAHPEIVDLTVPKNKDLHLPKKSSSAVSVKHGQRRNGHFGQKAGRVFEALTKQIFTAETQLRACKFYSDADTTIKAFQRHSEMMGCAAVQMCLL